MVFGTFGVPKSTSFWSHVRAHFEILFDFFFGSPVFGSAGQLKSLLPTLLPTLTNSAGPQDLAIE